jgi:type II secretory pathway component PulK
MSSILLAGVLVVSLGLFRNLFFHIKLAQNHTRSSQTYWLLEGGVECAYARLEQQADVLDLLSSDTSLTTFNYCQQQMTLDRLSVAPLGNSLFAIRASKGSYALNKHFYYAAETGITWLAGGWDIE